MPYRVTITRPDDATIWRLTIQPKIDEIIRRLFEDMINRSHMYWDDGMVREFLSHTGPLVSESVTQALSEKNAYEKVWDSAAAVLADSRFISIKTLALCLYGPSAMVPSDLTGLKKLGDLVFSRKPDAHIRMGWIHDAKTSRDSVTITLVAIRE